MVNIFGPDGRETTFATTTRPPDEVSGVAADTWFKDCSGPGAKDGTKIRSAWLNKMLANIRHAIRGMGVPENELDDLMLLKAIQAADKGIVSAGGGVPVYGGLNEESTTHILKSLTAGAGISLQEDAGLITISMGSGSGGGDPQSPSVLPEFTALYQATDGGEKPPGGDWQTLPLNTVMASQVDGASLVLNRITLPAGRYRADGFCQVPIGIHNHHRRLRDVTNGVDVVPAAASFSNVYQMENAPIMGSFVLDETAEIELQTRAWHTTPYGVAYAGAGQPWASTPVVGHFVRFVKTG